MNEQYTIPVVNLDPFLPKKLEGAPSREQILAATQRALGNHVSMPANDGMERPRVPMTAAEAAEFKESLKPHVERLIEQVRSGQVRQRLLAQRAIEQSSPDTI